MTTTTANLSLYGGNLALEFLFRRSGLYLALHTADPTALGLASTELAGDGYARQPISFTVPSGKATTNAVKAYFAGLPPAIIWGMAVWDSSSALGNMILPIRLPNPIPVPEDGMFKIEPGDLAPKF